MTLKEWNHEDYPIIEEWYTKRHLPPPPRLLLPDLGYLASDSEMERGAIWADMSNHRGVAYIVGFVTNPKNTSSISREAGTLLLGRLHRKLKELDYTFVRLFTSIPAMERELEKFGYICDPTPYRHAEIDLNSWQH